MSDLILLGHVARAFGIEGGVVVKLINQESTSLDVGTHVVLRLPSGKESTLTVKHVMHGGRVFFDEISDRNYAESLKGSSLLISRDAFPVLDDDEFYLTDLVHARVIGMDDNAIGELVGFSTNGPQILLEIKTVSGYVALVPAVRPLINHIDYDDKIIKLDAPQALLEPLE